MIYSKDSRLIVTFRDLKRRVIETEEGARDFEEGPFHGDFVACVGTYDDILEGKQGQYKIRLIDNKGKPGDTGYSGIELSTDDTIISTVNSVRYRLDEIDSLAKIQKK